MPRGYGQLPDRGRSLDNGGATLFSADVSRYRRSGARVAALGALALAVGAVVVVVVVWRLAHPPGPDAKLQDYAAAWTRGDDRGAGALTDNPKAATAALIANRKGLDGAHVSASAADVSSHGDQATGTLRVRWNVPSVGPWSYTTKVTLFRSGGDWQVAWKPTDIHPRLTASNLRLGTVRDDPPRAPITDRDGAPLISSRAVDRVGIDRATVKDIDATATALAAVLDVNAANLARAARRAGPKQFVEALTLRHSQYAPLADQITPIQGAQVVPDTAQLAPTRGFARALLGSVAPATAEQIAASHGKLAVGDDVGQWGLEARYQPQLAGTPAHKIVVRRRGVPTATLLTKGGTKGRALRTTLDRQVQQAAEAALGPSQ